MDGGRAGHDVAEFLPLTDLAFSILLALSGEPHHGYGLLKNLRARTGRATIRTGTVYAALARLEDQGLVCEVQDGLDIEAGDERRRYYEVTTLGRAVARAEADRLRGLLEEADARGLWADRT